jgi:sodium/bile acid cotransporter 7
MKKLPVFPIALGLSFFFAIVFKQPGTWLYDLGWTSTVTIMLMYVGMGLNTDTELLLKGLENWKLHLSVQVAIFIIAPIVALLLFFILSEFGYTERSVGLLFVGAVPTTITSCIMLTKRYGGNAVGSLYNAVLSQVLGVVVTPLLLSLILSARFETVNSFASVLLSLIQKMIVPFIVGQLLRKFKHLIGKIGQIGSFYGIFFILFMNLAKVASQGDLGTTLGALTVPLGSAVLLCAVQVLATYAEGLLLRLSVEDSICLLFTGSQKTMGMGVPLAAIYFSGTADIAMDATLVIIMYYLAAMVLTVAMVPLVVRTRRA